jgi:hypothetical protein
MRAGAAYTAALIFRLPAWWPKEANMIKALHPC